MTDGTGTTSYGYDQYGRLSSVTDGAGAVVGYSYDTLGRVATITYPDTNAITRAHDAAGRLQSVTDWNNQTTSFGYDGDGNLTTTTYPNGVVDTTVVDGADDATGVTVTDGANTLASFGYTYTPSGLVDTTTDSLAPQTNRDYGYNKLHQLVGLDAQTTAYAYDHADNLTTLPDGSTMTYDPAGQLQTLTPTSGTATDYGFDGVGNRTTATGGTTAAYGYNQSDQLTNSSTSAGSATYGYDGDGLRAASADTGGGHTFAWDSLTASLPLLLSDGMNDYVYGPNDKVVEQVDENSEATTFLHQDRAGSTRLLTDDTGVVVGSSSYDPYGKVISRTGTATSSFGYDGEYTDPTGLIYLRARYYDPATGQFLTLDPLVDTTRAPYGYAGGDPVNAADPAGLGPCSASGGGGCYDGTGRNAAQVAFAKKANDAWAVAKYENPAIDDYGADKYSDTTKEILDGLISPHDADGADLMEAAIAWHEHEQLQEFRRLAAGAMFAEIALAAVGVTVAVTAGVAAAPGLATAAAGTAGPTELTGAMRALIAKRAGFSGTGPRIIVDENLPGSWAAGLRQAGYDARSVSEMGLRGASDPQLGQLADQVGARVLTRDVGHDIGGGFPSNGIVIDSRVNSLDTVLRILEGG